MLIKKFAISFKAYGVNPLLFQTYLTDLTEKVRNTTLGCKDIGIRKIRFCDRDAIPFEQ